MTDRSDRRRWPVSDLQKFAEATLVAVDVPVGSAAAIVGDLLAAELGGVSSHGLALLPRYARGLKSRMVNAQPKVAIDQRGAVLKVDGGNGLGYVVARAAMEGAIQAAARLGVGVAVARNSNHFGAAGNYARMAAERDMIGFATTNAPPVLAPWGGRTPALGNNPLAWAIPTRDGPLVFDMACSVVTRTKIRWAAESGQPIGNGWALDASGRPTSDPVAALNGSLMPVGEHKGSGLALIDECLAGALSGSLMALEIPTRILTAGGSKEQDSWGIGHFLLALDVGSFMEVGHFKDRVGRIIVDVKSSQPAEGKTIRLPGELEAERADICQRDGVPLTTSTEELLREIGAELHVAFPRPMNSESVSPP